MSNYDPNTRLLGDYLVDAGLLTSAQVEVILQDQHISPLRFGELVVQRGWVTQKTIDFICKKVVTLEREMGQPLHSDVFFKAMQERKKAKKRI